MTGLTMSGQTPSSGQVLTASDSSGDATWSSAGSVAGWTISGNNIYNTNRGNVGINTLNGANVGIGTSTPQGGFVVTNGNVGIGTWAPANLLDVKGPINITNITNAGFETIYFNSAMVGDNSGLSIIAGSNLTNAGFNIVTRNAGGNQVSAFGINHDGNVGIGTITPIGGLSVMSGNVGIGTWVPSQALSVYGNITASGSITANSGMPH